MIKFLPVIFLTILLWGCESSVMPDPSTIIQYSLPEPGHIKVTVENSYHTVIAVLADGDYEAGFYRVDFSPDNLAEGAYFYTLEFTSKSSGKTTTTTRVLLLVK